MTRMRLTPRQTELTEPMPCDGCPMFERCRTQRLACDAYHAYALTGRNLARSVRIAVTGSRPRVVGHGPLNPTRKRYERCFPKWNKEDSGW